MYVRTYSNEIPYQKARSAHSNPTSVELAEQALNHIVPDCVGIKFGGNEFEVFFDRLPRQSFCHISHLRLQYLAPKENHNENITAYRHCIIDCVDRKAVDRRYPIEGNDKVIVW